MSKDNVWDGIWAHARYVDGTLKISIGDLAAALRCPVEYEGAEYLDEASALDVAIGCSGPIAIGLQREVVATVLDARGPRR